MQTPRRLNTHQKAVLIQVLLAFPDQQVEVGYDPSASDALGYAHDFVTIFNVIGWTVKEGAPSKIANGLSRGLSLVVSTPGSLPASGEAFRDALRIYEIEAATLCDPTSSVTPGGFLLGIGRQP
jgi:hypothetical protein